MFTDLFRPPEAQPKDQPETQVKPLPEVTAPETGPSRPVMVQNAKIVAREGERRSDEGTGDTYFWVSGKVAGYPDATPERSYYVQQITNANGSRLSPEQIAEFRDNNPKVAVELRATSATQIPGESHARQAYHGRLLPMPTDPTIAAEPAELPANAERVTQETVFEKATIKRQISPGDEFYSFVVSDASGRYAKVGSFVTDLTTPVAETLSWDRLQELLAENPNPRVRIEPNKRNPELGLARAMIIPEVK